jgi:hypothetical protein
MAPQFDRPLRDSIATCRMRDGPARQGQSRNLERPLTKRNFAVPIGIPSRHTANAILRQAGLPKAS